MRLLLHAAGAPCYGAVGFFIMSAFFQLSKVLAIQSLDSEIDLKQGSGGKCRQAYLHIDKFIFPSMQDTRSTLMAILTLT